MILLFSTDLLRKVPERRDLIQNIEGLIELLYCLSLCSVWLEVSRNNDNDSQNIMCWALFWPTKPEKMIKLYGTHHAYIYSNPISAQRRLLVVQKIAHSRMFVFVRKVVDFGAKNQAFPNIFAAFLARELYISYNMYVSMYCIRSILPEHYYTYILCNIF